MEKEIRDYRDLEIERICYFLKENRTLYYNRSEKLQIKGYDKCVKFAEALKNRLYGSGCNWNDLYARVKYMRKKNDLYGYKDLGIKKSVERSMILFEAESFLRIYKKF